MKEAEEEKYKLSAGPHSSFISNALLGNLTGENSFLRSGSLDSSSFALSPSKAVPHLPGSLDFLKKPDSISSLNPVQLNQLYSNYENLFSGTKSTN